jgi:TctA family transporter
VAGLMVENLALGFSTALSLQNLLYCVVGVTLGTFIGVLPGVGPLLTISMLLPLTYGMSPEGAIIMLAGIYYGASYGGSTTAILVNLPGESSSVITCIDGHQMARQGRAGPALAIAAIGSFIAGCIGTVLIALFAPILKDVAIEFGSEAYASLILMALVATASLVRGSLLNGLCMALLGVLVGMVGGDVNSGVIRFSFGYLELMNGIDFAVVALGIFAIAEIVNILEKPQEQGTIAPAPRHLLPTRADLAASWRPILRGTAIGSFFGILPGTGPTISAFGSYYLETKLARDPSRFGRGAIEGVAAPESANNAAAQTAFIPTMTLGVPGSATMALMLGALMIQGVNPGPSMISEHPALFWGLVASMWVGNLLLLVLNLPLVGLWVRMLRVPYRWLYPAILTFSCVGIYTLNFRAFDVALAVIFGIFGYLMIKLRCEPVPFILGIILGPMLEEHLRRALVISHGDPTVFLTRPISAAFLVAALALIVFMLLPLVRRRKGRVLDQEE